MARMTCPVCRGEGNCDIESLVKRPLSDNDYYFRVVMSIVFIVTLIVVSITVYNIIEAQIPRLTAIERCATSCGPGRFKAYELAHTEMVGDGHGGATRLDRPERCVCIDTPEKTP